MTFSFDAVGILLFTMLEYLVAFALFAHKLPRKAGFGRRFPVIVVVFALASVMCSLLWFSAAYGGGRFNQLSLVFFGGVFFCFIGCARLLFDTSWANAIYIAVAVYTVQSIESGVTGIYNEVVWSSGVVPLATASYPVMLLVDACVLVACYAFLVRKTGTLLASVSEDRGSFLMISLVLVAALGMDVAIKELVQAHGLEFSVFLILRLSHLLLCVLILALSYELLYNKHLVMDVAIGKQLLESEKKQFESSRENIEAINMKCHEIRHQLRRIGRQTDVSDDRFFEDMAQAVNIYDGAIETGNSAIDTILTENSLICRKRNITLNCIVDGSVLEFMSSSDLYSLFGNALENAVEAVSKMEDAGRRTIGVDVRQACGTALIHIENYFAGTVSFDDDGLPVTSKGDTLSHGYGVKSMRMIVEKYGGTLAMSADEGIFNFDAMIPLLEEERGCAPAV